MATRHINEIGFKEVQLFKDQTLGIGAYGKVCRARCDNLDCAAKLLHETLFDRSAERLVSLHKEHRLPVRRFEKECEFLNAIKHPNIIQYLGIYHDSSSGLAVLLMELMDCSLTNYLETSQYLQSCGVPFYIQVNICHDVTLALSFLHSNGIIHRDLSGNNILLSGQPNIRAKVTDFGMASLSDQLSPRPLCFTYTMCPGTDAYMPPEAVKEQPLYSKKIDCFSFGVIVLQILTKKFPKPKDRWKEIEVNGFTAFVPVPEHERRHEHINEADSESPLLRVSLDCLTDKAVYRPSSHQLCETIRRLRETHKYRESVARTPVQDEQRDQLHVTSVDKRHLEEQIARLKECHTLEVDKLQKVIRNQAENLAEEIKQRDQIVRHQKEELYQKDIVLQQKEEALIQRDETIKARQSEIQRLKHQLDQERVHRTMLEKKVLKFEEQQQKFPPHTHHHEVQYPSPAFTAKTEVEQRTTKISLRWGEGWNMPCPMERGCDAVIKGSTVFFAVAGSTRVYNFSSTNNTCFSLPDCPLCFSSLAIINDELTAVGGSQLGSGGHPKLFSNKLYSFTESGLWIEKFSQMSTKKDSTTSLNTGTVLVVAGGRNKGSSCLNIVEVLSTETLQWFSAPSLPIPLRNASAAMCGSKVYLLGGVDRDFFGSKTVFTYSVNALVKSCEPKSLGARFMSSVTSPHMWNRVSDLPVTKSTCTSFCGYLLAVGGEDLDYVPTKDVYMYNPMHNSWKVVSQMLVARSNCVVASLPGNRLMVGGRAGIGLRNNNVEFASIA